MLTVLLVSFALAHREAVEVVYSPVHDPILLPLYALVLSFAAGGFVLGGVLVWLAGVKTRAEKRAQKKQITRLEKELARLDAHSVKDMRAPVSELLPALGTSSKAPVKGDVKSAAL